MDVHRERVVKLENLQISENLFLRSLSEGETYKYLSISKSLDISDTNMKQVMKIRFFSRLKKALLRF